MTFLISLALHLNATDDIEALFGTIQESFQHNLKILSAQFEIIREAQLKKERFR